MRDKTPTPADATLARVNVLPDRAELAGARVTVSVPLRMRVLWGIVALGGAILIGWMSAERLEGWPLRNAVAVVGCAHVVMGILGLLHREISIPLRPAEETEKPAFEEDRSTGAAALRFQRRSSES